MLPTKDVACPWIPLGLCPQTLAASPSQNPGSATVANPNRNHHTDVYLSCSKSVVHVFTQKSSIVSSHELDLCSKTREAVRPSTRLLVQFASNYFFIYYENRSNWSEQLLKFYYKHVTSEN